MSADLEDRTRLAENVLFQERVRGAMFVVANQVGDEDTTQQSDRADRRVDLAYNVLTDPAGYAARFARAAAGWNPTTPTTDIADTFADATGTDDVKQAAVNDNTIVAYVTGAWDVLAGVRPWERS